MRCTRNTLRASSTRIPWQIQPAQPRKGYAITRGQRHRTCAGHHSEEQYARIAAQRAVDAFVSSGCTVGLGHGKMVLFAVEYLAKSMQEGRLQDVKCLSASHMTSVEAAVHGIPLMNFQDTNIQPNVTLFEGDELDTSGLTLSVITGRAYEGPSAQQPQLPKLRQLLDRSLQSIALISGPEKVVRRLGGALPVVVEGANWEDTAEALDDIFLGDAEIWRRPREGTANPRGGNNPYISQEGHNIVDIKFLSSLKLYGEVADYEEIVKEIMALDGVVAHGLVLGTTSAAIIANGVEAKIVEKGLLLGFKDNS